MKKLLIPLLLLACTIPTMATTISFLEEFPDEPNLEKITNIGFDTKIYIASENLTQFYKHEQELKNKNPHVKEVVYWPILKREEGYWISPWAETAVLERVFEEIKGRGSTKNLEILLDMEPPLKRSKLLNFKQFSHNKKYITDFVGDAKKYNLSITTAEKSYIPDKILELAGLSFPPRTYGNKKMKMYYSSYRRIFLSGSLADKLYERKIRKYNKEGAMVGIGLIAPGIHNESSLNTPKDLQREIRIAYSHGLKEVVVYRVGGLNDEYMDSIKEFA